MSVRVASTERIDAIARTLFGETLEPQCVAAELLRGEVSGRGSTTRASAVAKVLRSSSSIPWTEVGQGLDRDMVTDVLELLIQSGEFSPGAGGLLWATPVRLVDLEGGNWRIVSSLPLSRLQRAFPGTIRVDGTRRSLCSPNGASDAVLEALAGLGGTALSPDFWAGLDLTPSADQQWLDALCQRESLEPERRTRLDQDEQMEWRGLEVTGDMATWKSASNGSALWRSRNRLGHWLWAWSSGGSPQNYDFVSLTADEARRTLFALARTQGSGICAELSSDTEKAVLSLSEWLPSAEYRYLSIVSMSFVREGKWNRWAIPLRQLKSVADFLSSRLGIRVEKEGPEG